MPQFTATIWPALRYTQPSGTAITKNGGAAPTNASQKALRYTQPSGLAVSGNGGSAPVNSPLKNMQRVTPTANSINWTPAVRGPFTTTYVNPITTTDAIRAFFKIQPPLGTVNALAVASND